MPLPSFSSRYQCHPTGNKRSQLTYTLTCPGGTSCEICPGPQSTSLVHSDAGVCSSSQWCPQNPETFRVLSPSLVGNGLCHLRTTCTPRHVLPISQSNYLKMPHFTLRSTKWFRTNISTPICSFRQYSMMSIIVFLFRWLFLLRQLHMRLSEYYYFNNWLTILLPRMLANLKIPSYSFVFLSTWYLMS